MINLVCANDEVAWVPWKFTAEERVPSLSYEWGYRRLRNRERENTSVSASR